MKATTDNTFYSLLRISFLAFSFCSLLPSTYFSQEIKEHKGRYVLSEQLKGRAVFNYQIKNGDKFKEGPFLFTLNLEDSIDLAYKEKYQLQGNYSNGQKVGDWEFSFSSLYPEDYRFIDGFYIKETASGKFFSIKSNFKDGLAHDRWIATEVNIENSTVSDTNYFSSAEFKEGQFINDIKVQNKTHQLVGEIDKNSFLNGDWIIFHSDSSKVIIEYKKYDAGILTSHIIEVDGKKHNLNYEGIGNLNETDDLLTSIPVDNTYFEILKFGSLGSIDQIDISSNTINNVQNATQKIIIGAFNNFTTYNGVNVWDSEKQFNLPKAKVKKYPFTNNEKNAIQESTKIIKETSEYLNHFLHVAQVEISKNVNDTIAKYYEVYLHYEKAFLNIKATFQNLQKTAFEYVNRSLIIPKIFKGTDYPNAVVYENNDKKNEFYFDFPTSLNSSEATINSLYAQLEKIRDDLKVIDSKIQPILKKEEQRADLTHDEQELVEKRDSIVAKFSDKAKLNEFQKKVSTEVISYVEKEFKLYAQQSLDKKIETLSSTLTCFDHFLKLYDQLEKLPKKMSDIKELYTRTVWNPFTMTDMNEIVKERVFNAYKDHLVPYFMDQLEKKINCKDLDGKMKDLNKLFKKMKELRDQDTSELERKIKRESDPEKLIHAFQLNADKQ